MSIEIKGPRDNYYDSHADIRVELKKLNQQIKKSQAIINKSQKDMKKLHRIKDSQEGSNFPLLWLLEKMF